MDTTAALLGISAIIHILPLTGVLGASSLERLYGVAITEPNLLLAMRHRAVLFGLLGAFLVVAAWEPRHRPAAIGLVLFADVAFAALAVATPDRNAKMNRVLIADLISIGCLLAAAVL